MNTPTRSVLALAATAALTMAFAPAGFGPVDGNADSALDVPEGAAWEQVTFPSRDGTMLQADVLRPADGCPDEGCTPVVAIGPYFGTSTQSSPLTPNVLAQNTPSARFDDFITYNFDFGDGDTGTVFDRGYAFVMVDSRGFGESGGCNDYGGIGEQDDAYAAVEWAGTQDWSTGRVGMWGKSYDGWTQVMAMANNPPHLDAVVVQSPIIDGYGIAWDDGVHHDTGWFLTTHLYQLYDQAPPSLNYAAADPEQYLLAEAGTADTCWAEQSVPPVVGHDRDLEYWRQRDMRPGASRNDDVAVLFSHGWNDVNTKPDQIFGAYTLAPTADQDADRRAWFGHWAHDRGNQPGLVGRDGFLEEALDWFDGHLRDLPFRYEANAQNVVEVHDQTGAWRTEASYPPADVAMTTLELNTGSYTDDLGGNANDGYWTIGEPVTVPTRIAGEPEVEVTADFLIPGAQFVGVLYDVDAESGRATEISRFPMRLDESGVTERSLGTPSDYVLEPGHQLAFQVRSDHPESQPYPTLQDVTVTALSVDVPFLTYERVSNLVGQRSQAGPFTLNVGSVDLTPNATFTLPTPVMPSPELREQLQPTVTTGDVDACRLNTTWLGADGTYEVYDGFCAQVAAG